LDKWLGFDEGSPNCPRTLAFLNVFGGIICVIVIVVVFFLFNKKLKRLKKNADRMNGLGILGEFQGQADAKWIVIREPLRGHSDTPYRRPTPDRPLGV
jgi:hypothetical protein